VRGCCFTGIFQIKTSIARHKIQAHEDDSIDEVNTTETLVVNGRSGRINRGRLNRINLGRGINECLVAIGNGNGNAGR